MGKEKENSRMLGEIFQGIMDLPPEMLGPIKDLVNKLLEKSGKEWHQRLNKFLRKERYCADDFNLELISGGQLLTVDAVDGNAILADAYDVFDYIDPRFKKLGADEKGVATEETNVEVYTLGKIETFSQAFCPFSFDLRRLCLTQDQIKNFVEKYRSWFCVDGLQKLFLFESKFNYFVAIVSFIDGKLGVYPYRFAGRLIWFTSRNHRVVVPKLAY